MSKQITKLLIGLSLFFSLLISQVAFIQAQNVAITPTPNPTQTGNPKQTATPNDPNAIAFSLLNKNEMQLTGPYDWAGFTFSVPADWELKQTPELDLSLGISVLSLVDDTQKPLDSFFIKNSGSVTIRLNNFFVGVIPLNHAGESNYSFQIPIEYFTTKSVDQTLPLEFSLESGTNCSTDIATKVFIHPTSKLVLPHSNVAPNTSLVSFPRPIYQNSFVKDSALVVVPDKPSTEEMKAALTTIAGLSNLSGNNLAVDLTTVSKLNGDQQKANHIIYVGKPSSLPNLNDLKIPLPSANNVFPNDNGNPDDVIIQMVDSPWSNPHVVLLVSGNTDAGVIKAAQAVSTGIIQPNKAPNLAVVDKVVTKAGVVNPLVTDQTLGARGYPLYVDQGKGLSFSDYVFYIPPGYQIDPGAYFDLIFGNSTRLNFNRSGIVVNLNDKPIGSVALSAVTANSPTNNAHIKIPAAAVVPGKNIIQLVINLIPVDDCTPPNLRQGLWATVWPESLLHIPLIASANTIVTNQLGLNNYISAFVYNPFLNDTAFVLPNNDLEAWRSAAKMSAFLGYQANGSITDLSVFYGDSIPVSDRSKNNFIMIGRPSDMPIVRELNNNLPAPFKDNNNVPAMNSFRVVYRVPPEAPMGYLELMPSSWNPAKIILSVFGNSQQGVSSATSALVDSTLSSSLAGNFSIINNSQVFNTDTTLLTESSNVAGATATLAPNETPQQVAGTKVPENIIASSRADWILPVIAILVGIIILIIVIVFVASWLRNRTRHKNN